MPSSYTPRLRLEMQAAGENLNTWGAPKLNTVIARIDHSIAGLATIALTGAYALTSSNTADDEARSAILKFTGTGAFTVTIPSVSKVYQVWNACTGGVTLTTGAGGTVEVGSGAVALIVCDGASVKAVRSSDMGGSRLTNVGEPLAAQDAATKAYADALAFNANVGILPGQAGSAGKFLTTNGTVASWGAPSVADISNYASDQAAKAATYAANDVATLNAAKALAAALAIAL